MTTPLNSSSGNVHASIEALIRTVGVAGAFSFASAQERQVTHAPHGHVLTNVGVWSPDGNWVVYDTREDDTVFDGSTIQQVNVRTGEVQTLYTARNGAACGVVTYHPREPKVIFILGPDQPDAAWTYGATRRRGVIVDTRKPETLRPLDAMNYALPFTRGALRGGSHVHVFSPDGDWVSFTYEDEVLARLGVDSPESPHDLNQRNVAVSVPAPSHDGVKVARTHPRNNDGDYFSVVVTATVNQPRPGSDEISRAYEEGWVVGRNGSRALAFIGNVTVPSGAQIPEVFLLELPANLTLQGDGLLEGTATRRPAPPAGVVQRRLTFTAGRKFPGVATTPRHWLRASPDGSKIAFLMKDDAGIVQLFTISPDGSGLRQVTCNAYPVASAFTWSPDGGTIAFVGLGQVCITDVATGRTQALTDPASSPALPQACVFSPDGSQIAFLRKVATDGGAFAQIFTVVVPSVAPRSTPPVARP